MLRKKFILMGNRKGIAPTVSTILMVFVVVVAMLLVISTGQNIISDRKAEMGESLKIERIRFNNTHVQIYIRNIGHGDINLENVVINDNLIPLIPKVILKDPSANPSGDATLITLDAVSVNGAEFSEGTYTISFISPRNKDLGGTNVEYLFPPIFVNIYPFLEAINDTKPVFEIVLKDSTSPYDIKSETIIFRVDDSLVPYTTSIIGNTFIVYHNASNRPLNEEIHSVEFSVSDTSGNLASKSWWFEVDITPPEKITNVQVVPDPIYGTTTLQISWHASSDVDFKHYKLYRSQSVSGPFECINNDAILTSYTDNGLDPASTYYYYVTAVDWAGNEGEPSLIAQGTTEGSGSDSPPLCSIDDPVSGQTINETYIILVSAVDDWEISTVELAIDSGSWISITSSFNGTYYSYDWDTMMEVNGSHTLDARAIDNGSHIVDAIPVVVNVQNSPIPLTTYLIQPSNYTDISDMWIRRDQAYDWDNSTSAAESAGKITNDIYWLDWNNTGFGTISRVDLRIRIFVDGLSDDYLDVYWYVNGTLGDSWRIDSSDNGVVTDIYWDNITEPNDGTWDWNEVGTLEIQQIGTRQETADTVSQYLTYEVWGWVKAEE